MLPGGLSELSMGDYLTVAEAGLEPALPSFNSAVFTPVSPA